MIAEALMSGTPVICSNNGACPEIVSPEAGFVCRERQDYLDAIDHLETIQPEACHACAMRDFHYLRMTGDYVREYLAEAGGAVRTTLIN